MRDLVTGAAGFLGSHLVDRLLAQGRTVVGLDNESTGSPSNLEAARGTGRFTYVKADVCEQDAPPGRFDRIWHLASPASPPDYQRLAVETLRVGSEGTRRLLERAQKDKARFLLASTSEVYGDPQVHPQPEDYWGHVNPVGPRSMYDESKRFAEAITMAFHRSRAVDTRIVRIFNTYGPRMRLDDGRVVPNFIGQALRGEPLTIYGDGSQTRSFCYYRDLVEGLLAVMEKAGHDPVNLGNPEELSIVEFARRVQDVCGRPLPIEHHGLPKDDPRQRRPDIAKAKALGWQPRTALREGLAETYAWFRKAGP